jgi:hypothetical protein
MGLNVRVGAAVVILAAAGTTGAAWADDAPLPAAMPAPEPAVLKGPTVKPAGEALSRLTLVERDFQGRVKELDTDPVSAALPKLGLDGTTLEACTIILAQRREILDRIVGDNLLTLLKIQQSRQTGDTGEVRRLTRELVGKAGELRERGRLMDELEGVMPADKHAELRRMVTEYVVASGGSHEGDGAMGDEGQGGGGDKAGRGGRGRAAAAGFASMLGAEIRRSYERVVGQRVAEFDALIKRLELTPEQEGKVRALAQASFDKNQGRKPSRAEGTRVFLEIYRELNEEQRAKLIEYVRGK